MLTYPIHPPESLALITTLRCNAACERCCFGCRPDRGKTMTLDEMKRYVDMCLEAYPDTIKVLDLTGGECFLLGDDLRRIIEYGHQNGLEVGVLTNGFWGTTLSKAYETIQSLKEAGLHGISFSTGPEHEHRLSVQSIVNAILASVRAGYLIELRVEYDYGCKSKVYEELQSNYHLKVLENIGLVQTSFMPWMDFSNEIKYGKWHSRRWCPDGISRGCEMLKGTIEITPYGDVVACPSVTCSRIPYLLLGNVNERPITEIYESLYADMLKVWLLKKGPMDILRYIYFHSNIRVHKCENPCHACMEIFGNPKILPFLRDTYDDWIKYL